MADKKRNKPPLNTNASAESPDSENSKGRPTDPNARVQEEVAGQRAGDRFVRVIRPKDPEFRRSSPGVLIATESATRPKGGLALGWYRFWRVLIGPPIPTSHSIHERLSKFQAMAVLSSDALSSVAYGPEEIFLQLMAAGFAALTFGIWIGIAIALLMVVVALSYRQTIRAYPGGGGSYIVAKDNLGTLPGLIAAASLMTDYVLTVAVSVSAGVAAITSAFPHLYDDRVLFCLGFIALITLGNLRGIRDSGAIFAAPTYVFVVTMYALIAIGVWKFITAGGHVQPLPHAPIVAVQGITLILILRAFASGCSAMTGLEAISDGVPAFKPPEFVNARTTLTWMVTILSTMFVGTMFLAIVYQAVPKPDGSETMISLIARGLVGVGPFYYLLQAMTAVILVLAANTSYSDFPRLSSFLARDRFIPKLFLLRGDRLAFTTGIVVLSVLSSILVIIFHGTTDALIPLYAIGVFVSFTLSQSGMVVHWRKLRTRGWQVAATFNGIGAVSTGVVAIITGAAKFVEGAWIVILIIPFLILNFLRINRHYNYVWQQLSVSSLTPTPLHAASTTGNQLVVPMGNVNKASLRALDYALKLSGDVTVVHVSDSPEDIERFQKRLHEWWPDARLIVIESPFRLLVGPLVAYLDTLHARHQQQTLTVVIPEYLVPHWWDQPLHNQTALRLKGALLFKEGVAVTSVPYHLE